MTVSSSESKTPHDVKLSSPRNLVNRFLTAYKAFRSRCSMLQASSVILLKVFEVYGIESEGCVGKSAAEVKGARSSSSIRSAQCQFSAKQKNPVPSMLIWLYGFRRAASMSASSSTSSSSSSSPSSSYRFGLRLSMVLWYLAWVIRCKLYISPIFWIQFDHMYPFVYSRTVRSIQLPLMNEFCLAFKFFPPVGRQVNRII